MPYPKKWIPVLAVVTAVLLVWIFEPLLPRPRIIWYVPRYEPIQVEPLGSPFIHQYGNGKSEDETARTSEDPANQLGAAQMPFRPGTVKAIGEVYTKTLVVPRTTEEDVGWIEENFGGNPNFRQAIYTVDDVSSTLHPPRNKGHEVMVYLSYIIDHYDNLSDVNMFMHSHRWGWHNNDLLGQDAVEMISRLSSERVQREGFMNMRCMWEPGCPAWMHPGTVEEDINKQEETMLAKSWSEIFPLDPIPLVLAQPCCAQFAISRDRIRSLPLARYVFYRDWLLRTSLSDYISGRVWEYVWQFVFTGHNVVCPKEHICYCDGFGVCFGGEQEYGNFNAKMKERVLLEDELRRWQELKTEADETGGPGPEVGKNMELQGRIEGLGAWCEERKKQAKEHGDVAMNRALEAGREWKDGDGF
jgi:hypothetical protein